MSNIDLEGREHEIECCIYNANEEISTVNHDLKKIISYSFDKTNFQKVADIYQAISKLEKAASFFIEAAKIEREIKQA